MTATAIPESRPPPPGADDDGLHVGALVEDLQPRGALSRDEDLQAGGALTRELDVGVQLLGHELPRAGGHRVGLELRVADGLVVVGGDRGDHVDDQRGVRLAGLDRHSERIDHSGAGDERLEVRQVGHRGVAHHAVDRGLDVVGRERRAVLHLHAVAQVERPRQLVVAEVEARRQVGHVLVVLVGCVERLGDRPQQREDQAAPTAQCGSTNASCRLGTPIVIVSVLASVRAAAAGDAANSAGGGGGPGGGRRGAGGGGGGRCGGAGRRSRRWCSGRARRRSRRRGRLGVAGAGREERGHRCGASGNQRAGGRTRRALARSAACSRRGDKGSARQARPWIGFPLIR